MLVHAGCRWELLAGCYACTPLPPLLPVRARCRRPSNAVVAPGAFRDATDALLQRLADSPGVPSTGPLAAAIKTYQSAAQQV